VSDPCQSAIEAWPPEVSRKLQESISEGSGSFVEVWDLAGNPDPVPRLRYWT
jgi:hypothetical protein